MVDRFDQNDFVKPSMVWTPFFGDPNAGGSRTLFSTDKNDVDIDIRKSTNTYAKLVMRAQIGDHIGTKKNLTNEQFTTLSRKYPFIQEKGAVNASQLNNRVFGENPYSMTATKQSRLRFLAYEQHVKSMQRIVNTFNILAGESILNGEMPAIFGTANPSLIYDMNRDPSLFYTPATQWDAGGATIWDDIETISDRVHKTGFVMPDAMFIGRVAMQAMLENPDFANLAENRRFNLVGLGSSNKTGQNPVSTMEPKFQKFVDAGWAYRGWIQTAQGYTLNVFTTPLFVNEEDGTPVPSMPEDKAMICYSQARCDQYFGPDEFLPLTGQMVQFYQEMLGISPESVPVDRLKDPNGWVRPEMFSCRATPTSDWKAVNIETHAAPIFATIHTDAFGNLQNLVTLP